jgi:hypothetical protein
MREMETASRQHLEEMQTWAERDLAELIMQEEAIELEMLEKQQELE